MAQTLLLGHERVDDIPLIIGLANKLHLAEVLEHHLGTHRLQQGLNNGQLAVGWLAYILSQADHRTSAVRDWANGIPRTLAHLLGHPIREVEFSDDRLGGVLARLSDDETWDAIERDLWTATVTVYELELAGMRLESTTSYGYHHVIDKGVMQRGHSKDHRPDLPQLKLMAAAAEPSGHLMACDVHPGQCADAPLYAPLLQRVRRIVGRPGLLYAGDCKMAALATRAEITAHHDFYLMPLPLTGETATQGETWVTAIVDGEPVCWTERVQVVRSPTLAQRQQATLEKRVAAAAEELRALTPPPGRGKRQSRDAAILQAALARVLARHDVAGLLTATWERPATTVSRYVGRGRGAPNRPTRTQV